MPLFMLLVFTLTLFFSAALLMLVQPMVGKLSLPLLGGTPAVWNTCMVFFQALLMAGYSYAHFLSAKLNVKKQVLVHAIVLAIPVVPLFLLRFDVAKVAGFWPPPSSVNPAWWLLAVLFLVAALPFFVVSTSAPLLQKWFAGTDHTSAKDPYFLYGASNLGSMLALLAYPLFVERLIGVQVQAILWAGGFLVLVALVLCCGRFNQKEQVSTQNDDPSDQSASMNFTNLLLALVCIIAFLLFPLVFRLSPTGHRWWAAGGLVLLFGGIFLPADLCRQLRWVALAFVPSSLMLGVTTHITTDIAAIPLLWIIPLALYLFSFVVVFSGVWLKNLLSWGILVAIASALGLYARNQIGAEDIEGGFEPLLWFVMEACCLAVFVYSFMLFGNRNPQFLHGLMVILLPVMILGVIFEYDLRQAEYLKEYQAITLHYAALFVTAMVCHGELARTRPAAAHLTGFFLLMSLGGVLGGLFNALVAPMAFDRIVEYPLVIALACILIPRIGATGDGLLPRLDFALGGMILVFGLLAGAFFFSKVYLTDEQVNQLVARLPPKDKLGPSAQKIVTWLRARIGNDDADLLVRERNFFGCFLVRRESDKNGVTAYHSMLHGTTLHGMQCYTPEERRDEPLTYFHRFGPIGKLFEAMYCREQSKLNICVLGVGTGTLAAYMKPAWRPTPNTTKWDLTLYEIDPAVERIARDRRFFTYLTDAENRGVQIQVDLGDGRLQIANAPDHSYDMIFMDAFTSDAVPVHLLTREAFKIYLDKLAPGGIIVVNIANRYLNFEEILGNLAADLKIHGRLSHGPSDQELQMFGSSWVVLAKNDEDFGILRDFARDAYATSWKPLTTNPSLGVWTDDYSNLLSVFNWKR